MAYGAAHQNECGVELLKERSCFLLYTLGLVQICRQHPVSLWGCGITVTSGKVMEVRGMWHKLWGGGGVV